MRKNQIKRSATKLTTLDSFLKEQGKLEEFEPIAIEEVLIWQRIRKPAAYPGPR